MEKLLHRAAMVTGVLGLGSLGLIFLFDLAYPDRWFSILSAFGMGMVFIGAGLTLVFSVIRAFRWFRQGNYVGALIIAAAIAMIVFDFLFGK